MTDAHARQVRVNGSACRVLEKGSGKPLVVLSGYGGLPRWDRFHDLLSTSHRVIAPSLPGQFGSERGHELLHTPLDWLAMLQDLLLACGLDEPIDLVATSVAGMLACELAAACGTSLDRLVLIGSYGLYEEDRPTLNLFTFSPADRPALLMRDVELYHAAYGPPADSDQAARDEYSVISYRNEEAVARLLWPFGDIGLSRRIHRITTPTLLVWGEEDQLVPPAYAQRFAEGMSGPTRVVSISGAGHLATADAPDQVASAIIDFIG